MKVIELRNWFRDELNESYPSEEVNSFFNILSEAYLQLSRAEISLNLQQEVSEENFQKFKNSTARLSNEEPIQYIIGETEFYGFTLKVTGDTLIPRPETEELVDWIIQEERNENPIESILDIGTGSGCIAISLSKNFPTTTIDAFDISGEALEIAKFNAQTNQAKVNFNKIDILETTQLLRQYDIIVSNPPYVRELERRDIMGNVLKYEPEQALFVSDENPLKFYKKIAQLALIHLKKSGSLYFEINEYLSEELIQLLQNMSFGNITLKDDVFGKPRMLKCKINEATK